MHLRVELIEPEQDEANRGQNRGDKVHEHIHGVQRTDSLLGSAGNVASSAQQSYEQSGRDRAAQLEHEAGTGRTQAVGTYAGLPLAVFDGVADHTVQQRRADAVKCSRDVQQRQNQRRGSIGRVQEEENQVEDEAEAIGHQQCAALTLAELDQFCAEERRHGADDAVDRSIERKQVRVAPNIGEIVHADGHSAVVQEAVDQKCEADDEQRRVFDEAVDHLFSGKLLLGRRFHNFLGAKDAGKHERDGQRANHDGCGGIATNHVALCAGEMGDQRDKDCRRDRAGDRGDKDAVARERCTLTRIRRDNAVERRERDVPGCCSHDSDKVQDAAVCGTRADTPVGMRPEQ